MLGKILRSKIVLGVVSLVVMGTFVFTNATMGYALKPRSTAQDDDRIAEVFGYGFATSRGVKLAHDKIFQVKAAQAFSEGRAIPLFGKDAIWEKGSKGFDSAAEELLQKSGMVGITKEEVKVRLAGALRFLNAVFDDNFINRIVTEIDKIDEAQVQKIIDAAGKAFGKAKTDLEKAKKKTDINKAERTLEEATHALSNAKNALGFLRMMKKIAAIEDPNLRKEEARKALVYNTRFITFLFGEKGIDPFLFSAGNILSEEYRALAAHIGNFPYEGSENIEGGPRTIYTTLARILGFDEHGQEGLELYQEMMLHEFKDRAYGRHVDPSREVLARLKKINAEIDKEYKDNIRQVATEFTEAGSVVVSNPKVMIEKYRLINDLGKKEVFAIQGSSKVHPNIPKGQEETITIAKADVGSIGGHGTAPGIMLEAVAEIWMQAAEQGYIKDFFITRVGDDISVTVTHKKGKDDVRIHELIWNGFVHAAVIAKDLGYYGAGQDLLADAFSGNVRGAGPSVAEMVIVEQESEVIIIGQADKTSPGAFNKGLYDIYFNPDRSTWHNLGPEEARDIKVGILDFDYNEKVGRRGWFGRDHYSEAHWYLGDQGRYCVDRVVSGKGEDIAAVTAQRLSIEAGEYVGKDDPMVIVRSQKRFPAVGEITHPFLLGDYLVEGWMRGSNIGPFLPVALQQAKIGIFDGPPLLSMWSFNLNEGKLEGFYDLMAANPAIRVIQDERAKTAVRMLQEGFRIGGTRGPSTEIAYQAAPERTEARLKREGVWEEFKPEGEAAEAQKAADAKHEEVALKVYMAKMQKAAQQAHKMLWGKLAVFADEFAGDIHYELPAKVQEINSAAEGKIYPILINHESLLKASPDGVMALQNIIEQLGKGNIKFVLHIARDDVKPEEADRIMDETLEAINKINGGYTNITRDMFAAVVVGTNPDDIANRVREKVGSGIYQVIGPQDYAKQFKDVIRVVLDPASKGQLTLMAKALKLGVELIATDGKLPPQELKQLDELFSQDAEGNFHVASADVVASVVSAAEEYARQVEAEVRV